MALPHTASRRRAAETARRTFEERVTAESLPTVDIAASKLADGLGVLDAFAAAKLVVSKSDARRQIKARALKINDEVVVGFLNDDPLPQG